MATPSVSALEKKYRTGRLEKSFIEIRRSLEPVRQSIGNARAAMIRAGHWREEAMLYAAEEEVRDLMEQLRSVIDEIRR